MTRDLVVVVIVGLLTTTAFTAIGVSNSQPPGAPTSPSGVTESMPTTTATESPNETTYLPPGTSESGIENVTLFLRTHRSLLTDETYSIRVATDQVSPVTTENGTFRGFDVGRITVTTRKGTDATLVTFADENVTHDDGTSSQSYWVTDETIALKESSENGLDRTTYTNLPRTGRYARLIDSGVTQLWDEPSILLEEYLVGIEYEHSGTVTRNGRTLHRFTSTGLNATAVEEYDLSELSPSVKRVDSTVLVDERGVVHSFDVSVTRVRENETVTADTSYTLSNLGKVSPSTPPWVTDELPHLDASLSGDGRIVKIGHTGGMTVSKASVLVSTSSSGVSTEFNGTFGPGESLYLYVLREGSDRLVVSRTERPEVNGSFVRLGENVSVTPWRVVSESRNSTTIEVTVRSERATRTTTPTTETSNETALQRVGTRRGSVEG